VRVKASCKAKKRGFKWVHWQLVLCKKVEKYWGKHFSVKNLKES
jgi:hypothetical protein